MTGCLHGCMEPSQEPLPPCPQIYMAKYAKPGMGIGHEGALQLVEACRAAGLKTAVASSADLVKVRSC